VTAVPGDVLDALVGFCRALREAGVDAGPDRVATMLTAAGALGAGTPTGVYWAGRLAVCSTPDDIPRYDAVFRAWFGDPDGRVRPTRPGSGRAVVVRVAGPGWGAPPAGADGDDAEPDGPAVALRASPAEVLRSRDVAGLSAAERDEVRRLVALLAPAAAPRATRRYRPARRGRVDSARTVRRLLRHAGEPATLARRRRSERPRRLVLLLDVSGSMAPYADALLRFGHAAVRRRPTLTEVFTLGTRLTRITRPLRYRDPDVALAAAGRSIPDWHGGTRLADVLRAFLSRWGRRGTARGAVVVLCSDGWERGDPVPLAEQVAGLARLAYRLIWVNPHRGKAGFAPLAGGMAAALPYVDDFVAGHSLAALEELVRVIARA
jgi:uncharacterized protein with von Willebrand factor type A (vWA) domain